MDVNSVYRGVTVLPGLSPSAAADSVGTELAPGSQSVVPVAASETGNSTRNSTDGQDGSPQSALPQGQTVAGYTRDPTTNTLVFMEIDPHSDTVVMQFPEEQVLKLKSYLAEIQRHEEADRKSTPGQVVAKIS